MPHSSLSRTRLGEMTVSSSFVISREYSGYERRGFSDKRGYGGEMTEDKPTSRHLVIGVTACCSINTHRAPTHILFYPLLYSHLSQTAKRLHATTRVDTSRYASISPDRPSRLRHSTHKRLDLSRRGIISLLMPGNWSL